MASKPTTARLDLTVWRNDDVFEYPLRVIGPDLTNVDLRMQARLQGDTPGAPALDLLKVTNGNAEGLRLAGVTTVDGVKHNDIRVRINKSTLQNPAKFPYAGEVGDTSWLEYALLIGGRTRLVGKIHAPAHAYGSDNAPTQRQISYGARSTTALPNAGATLTIAADHVAELVIDGADLLGALTAESEGLAVRSEAAAAISEESAAIATETALRTEYTTPVSFDPYAARQTAQAIPGGSTFIFPLTLAEHSGTNLTRRLKSMLFYTTAAVTGVVLKRVRKNASGNLDWVEDIATIDLVNGKTVYSVLGSVVFAPNEMPAAFMPGGTAALCQAGDSGLPAAYIGGNYVGANVDPARIAGIGVMMSAEFLETNVVAAQEQSATVALRARYPISLTVDPYGADPGTAAGTDKVTMFTDAFGQDGPLLGFNLRTQNATPNAIYAIFARQPDNTFDFIRKLGMKDLAAGDNPFVAGVDFPAIEIKANWVIGARAPGAGLSRSTRQYGDKAAAFTFNYNPAQNLEPTFRPFPLRASFTIGTAAPAQAAPAEHQSFKRLWTFRFPAYVATAQGTLDLPYYDLPIYPPTMTDRGLGDAYVRKGIGKYTGLPANSAFGNINVARDPIEGNTLWFGHLAGAPYSTMALGRSDDRGKTIKTVWTMPTPAFAQNSYICAPYVDFEGKLYLVLTYQVSSTDFGLWLFRSTNADGTAFESLGRMIGPAFDSKQVIDGTMYRRGDTYYVAAKNEVTKTIFVASSKSIAGPWGMAWDMGTDKRFGLPNGGIAVEGPKLSFRDDGSVRVYFDRYSTGASYEGFAFADAPYLGGPLGPIYAITTPDDFNPPREGGARNPPRAGEVVEMLR